MRKSPTPIGLKGIITALIIIACLPLSAQNQHFANNSSSISKEGWTIKEPFKNAVFIENKGQFDTPHGQSIKDVQYAINNGSLKVYFQTSGLSYHVTNVQLKPQYEPEKHEIFEKIEHSIHKNGNTKQDESLKKYFIDKSAYVNIEWADANPDARILVSEPVPDNYSYFSKEENGQDRSIIARAFKKLTYKNIYPNIDIEYYFPDDSRKELGVKYNIVVYPGGDLSKVKMKYSGMQGISLDQKGNIIAAIPEGNITDHAPDFSFVGVEDNRVQAKFILQNQTVSFNVMNYDKTQKLVIDPFTSIWSINPGFTTANDGYTIRIDYNQNVYVMGGGINMGGFPFTRWDYQVKKFNPAGVLQWTALTQSANMGTYGDLVVLRSGKAIVGHAFGSGSTVYIMDPGTGAITTKTTAVEPGWRFSYNLALNNNVLWMGGGSSNGAHLYETDTNFTAVIKHNPWTTAGNTEDICYLAQDKAGAFIYVTNSTNSSPNSSTTAPKFVKASTATPGTAVWKVNEPNVMMELGQGSFINGGAASFGRGWATGINGMVVCNDRIYTYDGNTIRAYDSSNGNIVNTVTVGGAFDKYSGIDADDCCRIYVGVNGVVKRYSSNLVFDASFNVTSDVYDLRFDPLDDDFIYVTGKNFIQKLKSIIASNSCSSCINVTKTDVSGCTLGTASVTVNDPNATNPLTYSWNNGSTEQTLTGLTAGTYIVTVTDAASPCPLTWTDTVIITGTFVPCGPTVTATGGTICSGECVNLSATGASTPGPFTYTWQPGGLTGAGPNVCPTITTTYTVITTDGAGATASNIAVVTVSPTPVADFTMSPTSPVAPNTAIMFTDISTNPGSPLWNFGDPLSGIDNTSVLTSPTHTYPTENDYCITLSSANISSGCSDTITKCIVVIGEAVIIFPNVFTPNKDGVNDIFYFYTKGVSSLKCTIYDRWGLTMYEWDTVSGGWDGSAKNDKPAPDGVYYFIMEAIPANGAEIIKKQGFLQLLRQKTR